jgi:hypothetical protein
MLRLKELEEIDDARRGQGRMYDLPHVVLSCILAVASGANSYRAMARFIELRLEGLRKHTGLRWRQAPGHTGLRAILLGLDQHAIEQALRRQASAALSQAQTGHATTIAIDGKTLRGSLDRFADIAALQWVSAFATHERLVLGQIALVDGDKGGGEIAAAQQLIQDLGLQGKLFTLDALHCQKNTAGSRAKRQRRVGATQRQPAHAAAGDAAPGGARPARRFAS